MFCLINCHGEWLSFGARRVQFSVLCENCINCWVVLVYIHTFFLSSLTDEFGRKVRGKYDGPKINDYDKFCKYCDIAWTFTARSLPSYNLRCWLGVKKQLFISLQPEVMKISVSWTMHGSVEGPEDQYWVIPSCITKIVRVSKLTLVEQTCTL